jgi:hypothetical protein
MQGIPQGWSPHPVCILWQSRLPTINTLVSYALPMQCWADSLCCLRVQVLGVPTPETWPGYADLPHRIDFKPAPGQQLQQVFKQASTAGAGAGAGAVALA